MRRPILQVLPLGGLFAAALVTSPSRGDGAARPSDAVSTPPIVFHALPSGHVTSAPGEKARPGAVAGGTKAPGMFARNMPGNPGAVVFGSLAEAQASGFFPGSASASPTAPEQEVHSCVAAETFGRDEGPGEPWSPGDRQRSLSFQPGNDEPRVQATHTERLTSTPDGKATLEWVDAWVDAATAGAKTIAKGAVPLAKVASGPGGLLVYAARDEGWVHFVVRPGEPPIEGPMKEMARSMGSGIQARWPDGVRQSSSDCTFMRVSLPAGPTAKAMATFETPLVLPPLREASTAAPEDPMAGLRAMRSLRRRPLLVYVSSSQSSSDPEPVVSVAFGWGGPESTP